MRRREEHYFGGEKKAIEKIKVKGEEERGGFN